VQELMWASAGMVRSRESLETARLQLEQWTRWLDSPSGAGDHELRALLLVARLVTTAAIVREESRGGHRRTDYPNEDDAWLRRVVFRAGTASPERQEQERSIAPRSRSLERDVQD